MEVHYSRAVAGYFLFFEAPSTVQTALALRQAIWRNDDSRWHVCGIPDVLYTDNGRDFPSQHIEQVAADLKMRLVFSTPGMPRGRGHIERFFATISDMLLCELPGFKFVSSKVFENRKSLNLWSGLHLKRIISKSAVFENVRANLRPLPEHAAESQNRMQHSAGASYSLG